MSVKATKEESYELEFASTKDTPGIDHDIPVDHTPVENDSKVNDDLELQALQPLNTAEYLGKKLADSHDNKLSPAKARIVLAGMSLSLALSFIDLSGISVVMPYIAESIGAELTISWASTSQLIGMSLFQLLCGRFADIFGRRNFMVVSIITMGIFELACGLAKTDVQFFIFRAFCGIANGTIASLAMVILSDIVPLNKRGTYQGYLSISNGVGNVAGPFLASLFVLHSTWRKFFYTLFALSTTSSLIILWLVPNSQTKDVTLREKFRSIDYAGFLFGGVSLVLIAVPVNGGGLQFDWDSSKVIIMLVVGGVCGIAFVFIEVKIASLPLVPMGVFTQSRSLCLIFIQCFLSGLPFYSIWFFYGYYFEVVRGFSPIITSCFFLCVIIPHYTAATLGGRFVTWAGHYNPTLQTGFGCWTLALCLLAGTVREHTSLVGIAFILILNGLGQGLIFQNTLVAALAHSRQQDRAVVISARQVLRYFGGCVGLALSSLVFSHSFTKYMGSDSFINLAENASLKTYLRSHVFSRINLQQVNGDWNSEQIHYIRSLYMKSLKQVFTFWAPLIGTSFIISLLIKDKGLIGEDDTREQNKK